MDDKAALQLIVEYMEKRKAAKVSSMFDDPFEYDTCCEEEVSVNENGFRDVTVTAKGLTALVNEILHLRDGEMKQVEDGFTESGRRKFKTVEVPFEEKFQNLSLRTNGDKFVVQVMDSVLDVMNKNKARADKAAEWETLS